MLIPTKKNIATVTDLRTRTIELLKEVEKSGAKYLFQRSDPKAVLLSMNRFEELMDLQEQAEALSSVNFRNKIKKARSEKTYSAKQTVKIMDIIKDKKNGFVSLKKVQKDNGLSRN